MDNHNYSDVKIAEFMSRLQNRLRQLSCHALRCVAPQESRQFGARLSAGPHPVGDGTRACACAPVFVGPRRCTVGNWGGAVRGLWVHRCFGRRSPQPPAFLGPAPPQGHRPSVTAHRPSQPCRGLRCGVQRVPAAGPPACLPRRQPHLGGREQSVPAPARSGGEMSFFGFGQSVEVEILLNDAESRKRAEHKTEDGKKEKYFLFYDGETVSGKVSLSLKNPNKRLEHQGIKIEFIGQIELYYDRGNHHEFVSLVKDLARPGEITQSQAFDFEFTHVEKPYESYTGQNVKLRYFLRATISRRLNDVVKEMDIVVHTLSTYPELNSSIKMEVGIEDCLHIEFEYNKSKYHLKDVIVGKIYFLLVRIKIKHMEIDIIKRETTGTGPNVYHENDTIAKYEIMDGAPVRGESIPIRLFLAGYELTPTMRDINKKFSVRYYLNLVLIDEEERRYFKQQEVVLWRKGDIVRKSMSHQAAIASQRFEGTSSLGEVRTPGPLSDNNSRQ
ncbi:Vacuolar protein sorting-associated protein 26B [Microtus ochrogaster]|uniref:Vacuolar protein sorting-associated protein 26B n=3 Tax=Cricetidae TaxID=337677 RepID=A0A8J6GU19_MICOH|nr:Vacuolar protein sorting-associated protein 26B [Microtus ochrogaster]